MRRLRASLRSLVSQERRLECPLLTSLETRVPTSNFYRYLDAKLAYVSKEVVEATLGGLVVGPA